MSLDIRLWNGTITANDLLNTPSYLVSNWARQTDMQAGVQWRVSQPENGVMQEMSGSLEKGSGKFIGQVSSVIDFFYMTEDMRQFVHNIVMEGSPVSLVTAYLHHPIDGFQVYQGELLTPFAANAETSHTRFSDAIYTNNQYLFRRGVKVTQKTWGAIDGSAWSWIDGTAIGKVTQI